MVAGIWVYSLTMVSPTLSKTYDMPGYGRFGYNEDLGKCGYDDVQGPRVLFYSIGFGVPLILIVVSYFGIWTITMKSSSSLKCSG